jgi:hypothetical protein
VALAVAGYSLLLAVRQPPVGAGAPVSLSKIPALPEPKPLPRRASFVPASAEPSKRAFPPQLRTLTIEIDHLPASLWLTAGVAVFDDADFCCAWVPLPKAGTGGPRITVAARVPAGEPLRACVAASEAAARASYWASAQIAAELPSDSRVRIDVPVQEVVVHAASLSASLAAAVRLRRVGEPGWAPTTAFAGAPQADARGDIHMLLGPGAYELAPWTGAEQAMLLFVPGPREVTARFAP